jgi:response regulator NasT
VAGVRVLLIDESPERAAALADALQAQGYGLAAQLAPRAFSIRRVQEIAPEIVILAIEAPSREIIACLRQLDAELPRPVVMFVDRSDAAMTRQALQAGVAAYVIDGRAARRIKPILDVAVARFREAQALREELRKARAALAERKLIDRAKGLLMRERQLSEADAYAALRKLAMDRQQRLAETAESLLAFADLLNRR